MLNSISTANAEYHGWLILGTIRPISYGHLPN